MRIVAPIPQQAGPRIPQNPIFLKNGKNYPKQKKNKKNVQKYAKIWILVYTNKQMLVEVYLDPRRSYTTSKSAESGNQEAFVMVLYCHFINDEIFQQEERQNWTQKFEGMGYCINQYSRSLSGTKKDATFMLRHIVTECDMILPIFLDF